MFLSQPLDISESLLHFLLQIAVQIFYTLAMSLLHLADPDANRMQIHRIDHSFIIGMFLLDLLLHSVVGASDLGGGFEELG